MQPRSHIGGTLACVRGSSDGWRACPASSRARALRLAATRPPRAQVVETSRALVFENTMPAAQVVESSRGSGASMAVVVAGGGVVARVAHLEPRAAPRAAPRRQLRRRHGHLRGACLALNKHPNRRNCTNRAIVWLVP